MADNPALFAKRFPLEGRFEGWAAGSHLLYTPASRADYKNILDDSSFEDMKDGVAVEFMYDFVKQHVVGGQIVLETSDSTPEPFQPDYVDNFDRQLIEEVFAVILGRANSPKVSAAAQPQDGELPKDAAPTETSSSTD